MFISESSNALQHPPGTVRYLSGVPQSLSGNLQFLPRAPPCLTGTGSWILETAEYSTWSKASCSSLLWIRGNPGCGKSTLAKLVVEESMKDMFETSHREIVYVYFSAEHHQLNDLARGLLGSIIHAITNHRIHERDTLQHILASIEDRSRSLPPWRFQRFLEFLLQSDLSESRVYHFILDGVDDSSWVKEYVLDILLNSSLLSNKRHKIKCMVCSRIVLAPPDGLMTLQLDLDKGPTRQDVAVFIRSSIQHMSVIHPDHAGKLRSLETKLSDKIRRNFLLARLTVKEISRMITSSSTGVSDTFTDDWPSELEGMYQKMLRSIPSHYHLLAKQIFTWITYAIRPLHILELREALMVKPPTVIPASKLFWPGGYEDFSLKEDLSEICGGLVTISRDYTVEFIHRTVRDYFLAQHDNSYPDAFCVKWSYAHNYLAEACLQYLASDPDGARAMLDYHDYWLTSAKPGYQCPFSQYASMYWSEHYRLAEAYNIYLPGMLQSSLERLILQKEAKCPTCKLTDGPFHISVHMFYACIQMGFVNLGRTYLEMGVDINTTYHPYEETPLHLAVASCHLDMVNMLLTREASIEASTTGLGRTPLHLACSLGNIEMCILMIESGANKNARTEKYGETPLHLAVENGHLDIVQYLWATGADTNVATFVSGETPLHIAAAAGLWEESLCLLGGEVRMGAVISCINTSCDGQWERMRPMHRDIKLNVPYHEIRHTDRRTWDFREFCRFLSTDSYDTTGFNYAFESQHGRRHADIEARTKEGWTALHLAAAHGHQTICELLLKYGADPTATTPLGKAAIQLARESRHLRLVSMLDPPLLDEINLPPISQVRNMKSASERFRQKRRENRQTTKQLDDPSWTASCVSHPRRKNGSQTTKQLDGHNWIPVQPASSLNFNDHSTNLASVQRKDAVDKSSTNDNMSVPDDLYNHNFPKGEDGWIMLNRPDS